MAAVGRTCSVGMAGEPMIGKQFPLVVDAVAERSSVCSAERLDMSPELFLCRSCVFLQFSSSMQTLCFVNLRFVKRTGIEHLHSVNFLVAFAVRSLLDLSGSTAPTAQLPQLDIVLLSSFGISAEIVNDNSFTLLGEVTVDVIPNSRDFTTSRHLPTYMSLPSSAFFISPELDCVQN